MAKNNANLLSEARIAVLEAKMAKLQRSTRATVPVMVPVHDILRQKFRWYYNWHLNMWSKAVHSFVLLLYIGLASAFLYSSVFSQATLVMASSKKVWSSETEWNTWTVEKISTGARKGSLTLAPKTVIVEPTVPTTETTTLPTTTPPADSTTPTDSTETNNTPPIITPPVTEPEATPTPPTPATETPAVPTPQVQGVMTNRLAQLETAPAPTIIETPTTPVAETPTPETETPTVPTDSTLPTPDTTNTPTETTTPAPQATEALEYPSVGVATNTFTPYENEVVKWMGLESDEILNNQTIVKEFSTDNVLWTTDLGGLPNSRTLYVKITLMTKDKNVTPVLNSLTVNYSRLPLTPIIILPTEGDTIDNTNPILTTVPFQDPDNDKHYASEWQVTTTSGKYTSAKIATGEDRHDLTSYRLNNLAKGTYYWHVRFEDNTGAWSPWSKEASFTVKEDITPNDIVEKRTETTKTFQNADNTFTLESFSGITHYKEDYADPNSQWKDINPDHTIDTPDYVLFDQMPSTVKVYKDKVGYEIESRKTGKKIEVVLEEAPGAQTIPAEAVSIDGNLPVSDQSLTGESVLPTEIPESLPTEIQPETPAAVPVETPPVAPAQSMIETAKKLAQSVDLVGVADAQETVLSGQNLDFDFEISEYGVRLWKTIQGANAPRNFKWKVTQEGSGGDLKFQEDPEAFKIGNKNDQVEIATNKTKIDNSSFYWQETAPKSNLVIDTDVTYYSGVGDGYVTETVTTGTSYAAAHGATAGTAIDFTGTSAIASSYRGSGSPISTSTINRSFLPFNTAALPDTATITAATMSIYVTATVDQTNGDTYDYINVVGPTTQEHSANLALEDFDQCSTITNPTTGASNMDVTGITTSAYNDFALNASGISWISLTGTTFLGVRDGHDIQYVSPSSPPRTESVTYSTSEETGTGQDPKLAITYTEAAANTIQFTATSSNGSEATTPANLEVTLSAIQGTDASVDYVVTGGTATGGGTDYTLASGTATITAGNTTTNISPTITNDTLDEDGETIIVTISNPTNATLGANTIHTYTINDDDDPPTIAFTATSSNGAESVTPANLEVSLSTASSKNVSVDYVITGGTAVGGGVDYTLASGTATITAGNTTTNISATIVDDISPENAETIIVAISNPTNGTLGANTVHTYTINDNDDPPTIQFTATASNGAESVTPANLEVSLSTASGKNVTVDYAVTGGTAVGGGVDYTLANGTATITAGNLTTNISATIVDDISPESAETIIVTISNPTNGTLGANTVHTYTIDANDGITISGHVYTAEDKLTNVGAGKTVAVSVNGVASVNNDDTDAAGYFEILNVVGINALDPIVLYVDNEDVEANLVTQAVNGTTNITGLELYTNKIVLTYEETVGPMTNTILDAALGATPDDDIHYTANAAFDTAYELFIQASKEYKPGGTVTSIGDFDNNGTFTPEANTVNVAGSWDNAIAATFTAGGSTINFNGTTAGKTITTGGDPFYNLTINGQTGAGNPESKTWYPASDVSVAISNSTGPTHYAEVADANDGTYVYSATAGSFFRDIYGTDNASKLVPDGATGISVKVYIRGQASNDVNSSQGYVSIKSGDTTDDKQLATWGTNWTPVNYTWSTDPNTPGGTGDWTPSTANALGIGTSLFSTALTQARCAQVYAEVSYTTAGVAADWTLQDDLTVSNTLTTTSGTLTAAANTITTKDYSQGGGIFSAPTSADALNVSGNFAHTAGTFTAPVSSTVNLTATSGTQTISGSTSFVNLSATASAARTINFASGTTQTVTGTWTVDGDPGQLITLGRDGGVDPAQWHINPTAYNTESPTVDYVTVSNSYNDNTAQPINPAHWSDVTNNDYWAPPTTVSGTVYTNELQTTNVGIGKTVGVSVNGGAKATADTNADGEFTVIVTAIADNDPIVVFVDDESGVEANLVTQASGTGSIAGLELYTDKIVLTHQTNGPMTNTVLDAALGATPDDDIHYTANAAFDTAYELFIQASKEYKPGGTVTSIGDFDNNGTFTPEANTINIAGSWDNAIAATFTAGASTINFNGTTAGKTITTGGDPFYNLTVAGAESGSGSVSAFPGTGADGGADNPPGSTLAWSNPTNIQTDDADYASAPTSDGGTTDTHYLKGTNFDFSAVPDTATLNGVKLEVKRIRFEAGTGSDKVVSMVVGGSVTGDNKNNPGAWVTYPEAPEVISYGGAADLWGTGLTVAQLKGGTDFGFVLQATLTSLTPASKEADIFYFKATAYYTATVSDWTLQDDLTVSNMATVTSGTLTAEEHTITTKDYSQGGGVLSAPSTDMNVSGNFAQSAGTFTNNSGSVNFTKSGDQTIEAASSLYDLDKSGSGTLQVSNRALTASNSVTIGSGTVLYINGQNFTTGTLANNGFFKLKGKETTTITTMDVDSGVVEYAGYNVAENITVKDFNVGGDAVDYFHLKINDQNATKATFVLGAALNVDGNLDITLGTLDASATNYQINVAGDWLRTGSFTQREGTVVFDKASGTQTIYDGTSFYNLTTTTGATRTMAFEGNTTNNANTWTAYGAAANLLTLQSTDANNWTINPTTVAAPLTYHYLTVDKSINTGVAFCATRSSGTDTTGWSFSAGDSCNGEIQFTATSSNGAESSTSVNIEVSLGATQPTNASVDYVVTGGTATGGGTDYTLASGTATITAGSTTTNIPITIVNDTLDENDETIEVTISNPTNATLGANTIHTYTINDNDDPPTVTLARDNANIAENGGISTVSATLSAVSGKIVTVNLAFSGTATNIDDYLRSAESIVINPGDTTGNITLTSVDDPDIEGNETIITDIDTVINATEAISQQVTVTITDDDVVGITISGKVYTAEDKLTNVGVDKTVAVSVNGGPKFTADTNASGQFTVTVSAISPNDPIVVFVDNETGVNANLITQAANAESIAGLELYTGKIVLSNENAGPMTNAILNLANNLVDSDIHYTDDGGFDTAYELFIQSGKTYTPGGNVTSVGDFDINGVFVPSSNTVNVVGSWDTTGGALTNTGSTITFAATAGKNITSDGESFNNLIFNGAGGAWTAQDALAAAGTLTLTTGTFDANGFDIAAANVTATGSSTRTLDLGEGTWTVSGNWSLLGSNQTVQPRTSTVNLTGTGEITTAIKSTSPYDFYNLTVAGATKTTSLASSVYVANILTLATGTLSTPNNSPIFLMKSDGDPISNGGATISASVSYLPSASISIAGHAFGGTVRFSGSGGGDVTFSLTSNLSAQTIKVRHGNAIFKSILSTGTANISATDVLIGWGTASQGKIDFGSGAHTISGNLTKEAGTGTTGSVDFNSANVSIGGNVDFTGLSVTPGSSTVTMTATDIDNTITSALQSFNNLTFNGAGGYWKAQDTLAAAGTLTLTAGTFDANDQSIGCQDLVATGTAIRTLTMGNGTWTVTRNWDSSGTHQTITPENSTVNLTGTGNLRTKTSQVTPYDFYNLQAAANGKTTTVLADASVSNDLILSNGGTFFLNGFLSVRLYKSTGDPLTLNGATVTNGATEGTIIYRPSSSISVAGGTFNCHLYYSGLTNDVTFTLTTPVNAEKMAIFGFTNAKAATLDTTGQQISAENLYIGHYNLNQAYSGTLLANNSTIDVSGGLTIQSAGSSNSNTLNAMSSTINVGGNWTNRGTFVPNTSAVILDGTSQYVYGTTVFNNFTKESGGDTLRVENAKTLSSIGKITLKGTDTSNLRLRSTSTDNQWYINPSGTFAISNVNVQDSVNLISAYIDPASSVDSGNNIKWFPPANLTITASANEGCNITPSGSISVEYDSNQTFTMSANDGYTLSDVISDDISRGATASYTFNNVQSNHTIQAVCAKNPISITNPIIFTGVAGDTIVDLAWTNPASVYFTYTTLYRSTQAGVLGDVIADNLTNPATGSPIYHDSGLTNGTTYYYTLKSHDSFGNTSPATEQLALTPQSLPDTIAPTAPTNLRATDIGITYISVAWDASTDNVGVVGYVLYNTETGLQVAATAGTTYTFTDLTADTTYNWYVKAYDAAGNLSEPSNTLTVTTKTEPNNECIGDACACTGPDCNPSCTGPDCDPPDCIGPACDSVCTGPDCQKTEETSTYLVLANTPAKITAGKPFPENIKVMAVDNGGNLVKTYLRSVYFTSSDGKAILTWPQNDPYVFSAEDAGVHEFNGEDFRLYTIGEQKLTVSDNHVSASATIIVEGALSTIPEVFQKAQDKISSLIQDNGDKVNTTALVTTAALLAPPILINLMVGLGNLWSQLAYWFMQVLQLLGIRRRRKPWGVVFDSESGQPVKFALVKIFDKEYNRLIETAVCDSEGRYGFLVKPGAFYLTTKKGGYLFPSTQKASNFYQDIYNSGDIKVERKDEVITLNIPMDPEVKPSTGFRVTVILIKISKFFNLIRLPLLIFGTLFSVILLISSYNPWYFLSLTFYVLIFVWDYIRSFRARPYGVASDIFGHPLDTAIVRVYEKKTDRLVGTDVTDDIGRFRFMVTPGIYYVKATKPGYADFKSHMMYLEKERTTVSINVKMKKINR